MPAPSGFEYTVRSDGSVRITHHGRHATSLRGARAAEFLAEVGGDPQEVMARWTGNDKHGNERTARQHPRNRNRGRRQRAGQTARRSTGSCRGQLRHGGALGTPWWGWAAVVSAGRKLPGVIPGPRRECHAERSERD